jgi:hypothetical protein
MGFGIRDLWRFVIPAKAGIALAVAFTTATAKAKSDSRLRGNDDGLVFSNE